jgi:hypothetical protein
MRPVEAPREWVWPAAAAAGLTLLTVILLAIFTTDPGPAPAEAHVPVLREPLLRPPPVPPPSPPVEKKEPPPAKPEPKPSPRVPEEVKRPDPVRTGADALAAFRGSLPPKEESELMDEIPWGTWKADLQHAPQGEARFDPVTRSGVLTARRDGDRVWIKRQFLGAKAGVQVRYRLGAGATRFALALSFTRWLEFHAGGVELFRVASDESAHLVDQVPFEAIVTSGTVTVVPGLPHVLVFLEDRLLFSVPAADCADIEGLQLGASGGTVTIDSVRAKDRTR